MKLNDEVICIDNKPNGSSYIMKDVALTTGEDMTHFKMVNDFDKLGVTFEKIDTDFGFIKTNEKLEDYVILDGSKIEYEVTKSNERKIDKEVLSSAQKTPITFSEIKRKYAVAEPDMLSQEVSKEAIDKKWW